MRHIRTISMEDYGRIGDESKQSTNQVKIAFAHHCHTNQIVFVVATMHGKWTSGHSVEEQ